ncbi:MAG: DUF4112 domain-containing protein [Flavobacteriaceae bacterium]
MDDYFLDPILGLFPGVGDVISSVLSIYSLRIAWKLRSFPLFIAMLFNILLDLLIGLIPVAGTLGDFFFKSNKKNYKLAQGYIEGNPRIKSSIKKRMYAFILGVVLILLAIVQVWSWAVEFTTWLMGLF